MINACVLRKEAENDFINTYNLPEYKTIMYIFRFKAKDISTDNSLLLSREEQ